MSRGRRTEGTGTVVEKDELYSRSVHSWTNETRSRKYESERTNSAISFHAGQIDAGLITVTKLGIGLSKYTNSSPLLDLREQCFSILRVMGHILMFAFNLSMTVHGSGKTSRARHAPAILSLSSSSSFSSWNIVHVLYGSLDNIQCDHWLQ